jgi:uracil-DNA glycosylase
MNLFAHTRGPRDAKIAFVGEAWGEDEEKLKMPFMGRAGQELTRMFIDSGIQLRDVFLTNVFNLRPKDNDVLNLTVGKKLGLQTLPPLAKGKYLLPEYLPEIERLRDQLLAVKPNLVVPLGNTACWALLGSGGIGGLRGTVAESTLIPGLKVLPTYHPSAVLRQWAYRPIVLADFMKVLREAKSPEIHRPERWILIDPTLAELREWFYTPEGTLRPPRQGYFSADIETALKQITMVGFSDHIQYSAVIPFFDKRKEASRWSYWPDQETERQAWEIVKDVLESPFPKLFQNGLYDLQYLVKLGIRPRNCTDDTMLLHHSHYPELQKSLGFMGSIHTNEPAWKLMRKKRDELKKDE